MSQVQPIADAKPTTCLPFTAATSGVVQGFWPSLFEHLADRAWAEKLNQQDHTIIDIGSNPYTNAVSPSYEMEKHVLFGDGTP